MNLYNLFEDDSRTPNPNYAEELAYQIFKVAPGLDTTGAADEVLDYAFDLVVNDFGKKKAHALFAYDDDFDSDLVNAYLDLQMNQQAVDEGWKEKLAGAALAGTMALGAGGAHARVMPGADPDINRLTGKPIATQQATDTAPVRAEAPKGFSKEYLQQVVNGTHPRPMISVEKAQQLLSNMQEGEVYEADPRNFDSDEDYYAAQNAPAKRRSAPSDYPYSREEDDAYFNDIFRKKREAAKKAAQDKESGVTEGRVSEIAAEYEDYKKLSPREFFNMYRITKQAWLAKYKSMLPQQPTVEGQEVDASVVIGKLYDIIDHAENVIKNADFDNQVQKATIVRDRAVKALNMIKQGGNTPEAASAAFRYMQTGEQGVAEADKKKEDELEPKIKDVALQRAISRAKADFPTAGSGIEALSKDFMRSQDQDSKNFDQLRQAERKQDQMLSQIAKIDQEQEKEINDLDNQNSTLASRLQQLQNVNGELEKKLAAMSGRRAEKKSSASDTSVAPASTTSKPTEPGTRKTKTKSKTKAQPTKSSMKSTAAQLAAPKADPMAAMTHRIQKGDASIITPKQQALPFEPSDNVLEPTTTQQQLDPRFADARANATDVEPKYYADIAKKVASSPEEFKAAMSGVRENDDQEAKYSDKYQDMVARVGQKAREQEKSKPVDIKDLARRLAAIEASRKD